MEIKIVIVEMQRDAPENSLSIDKCKMIAFILNV